MLCLFLTLLVELFTGGESARYARFQEDYVPAIGDFATNGNVVYLGAKAKILKLHFARREFVAQFEVLSSKCPLGDDSCSDYTQHVLLADGRIFGAEQDKVCVTCGTHGGRPRCVIRDLGLLNVIREVRPLQFASAAHPGLTSIAVVHDNAFYYTSYVTNDTSHPILGMYSQHKQLTTKLDDKWFNNAQFVSVIPIDRHLYVFYKELTFDYPSPILTSRVARVCLTDPGGNKLLLHKHFRTFTKATITCTSPSTMSGVPDYSYNFIDGVAVPHESLTDPSRADRMMYAIFSNIPNGPCSASAVCAYNVADVHSNFTSDKFIRLEHGTTTHHTVSSVNSESCEQPRSLYDAHKYNFLRDPIKRTHDGPLNTAQCRRYTAIAADRINGIDVLFIATDDMTFIKMAVNGGVAYQVDSFRVRKETNPITKIVVAPNANYVLASGPDYLLRIPISQCKRFNDCNSCVASRDPYCGWCPTYNSCVATVSCPKPVTNYLEEFETANMCYHYQKLNNNNTRRVKKIKRRKRRK